MYSVSSTINVEVHLITPKPELLCFVFASFFHAFFNIALFPLSLFVPRGKIMNAYNYTFESTCIPVHRPNESLYSASFSCIGGAIVTRIILQSTPYVGCGFSVRIQKPKNIGKPSFNRALLSQIPGYLLHHQFVMRISPRVPLTGLPGFSECSGSVT